MKERYLLEDGGDNSFSLITDYDGNDEQAFDVNVKSGEILPVLPLRNMVLFPGVFLPITVGRKSSLKLFIIFARDIFLQKFYFTFKVRMSFDDASQT